MMLLFFFSPQSIQHDWSITLRNMALSIVKEQSPANLMTIRGNFYDLLNHCIPANLILKVNAFWDNGHFTDCFFPADSCSSFIGGYGLDFKS